MTSSGSIALDELFDEIDFVYRSRYRSASIVNSRFSRQWFCDRYAVKALSVHGGGAEFDRTSCNVGRATGCEDAMLNGLDDRTPSMDMTSSSSASQPDDGERGMVSGGGVDRC